MASVEKLMLDKIVVKMKRFNLDQLQQLIKILHLTIEWKDIVNMVSQCRLRLTISNIVSVIHHFIKDSDSIEQIYHRVLLVDAIYHQIGQWWTVSVDKVNKRLLDKEIIRNNIQSMLDKLNMKAIAFVMKCNQLFWVYINISEKKLNKNSVRLSTPYFFTIAPGKVSHVFHKPQNIDNRLLKIVIKSIGANKCKPYELSGKHIQSLVNLINDKNKENHQDNMQVLANNYKEEDVREYVQRLFGDKCQLLNKFTINMERDLSVVNNTNPDGKMCKSKIELKGDSVINGIKDMMMSGVLVAPYPDWVTRLPVLGKNCVNITYT